LLALPLLAVGEKGSSTWWNILRDSIRRSGPCTTKFAQWLATRPDLFPLFICENLQVGMNFAALHESLYCGLLTIDTPCYKCMLFWYIRVCRAMPTSIHGSRVRRH
jgi:hypothetical protein